MAKKNKSEIFNHMEPDNVKFAKGDGIEKTKIGEIDTSDQLTIVVEEEKPIEPESDFQSAFKNNIDQPTAERLANRLNDIAKGEDVDLNEVVEHVVSQVEVLHREKARRSQQNTRLIKRLRTTDPKGIKTCGRCGYRVPIARMDSKKNLCEICAS